jgi:hypothetical protein
VGTAVEIAAAYQAPLTLPGRRRGRQSGLDCGAWFAHSCGCPSGRLLCRLGRLATTSLQSAPGWTIS